MYIHGMRFRHVSLALLFGTLLFAFNAVASAQGPSASPMASVPTTRILAMGHLTAGTTRGTIGPVMQQEVRDTVKLYLAGKIDQWYFRTDAAGGVVFLLNCSTVEEAHALLEKLPLGQHHYMEFDLIPLGPLSPLSRLVEESPAAPKP